MPDPHRPADDNQPAEIPSDIPAVEETHEDFSEGQIPGLPAFHDPLREPGPTPSQREVPPLD